jgi:hypothetical protein
MLQVLMAFVLSVIGVLLKGLLNLTLAEVALFFAVPCVFFYKLFGNRPGFLVYVAMIGALGGAGAAFYGYVIVPIQYYYSVWGWIGVIAGVIAAILLPLELVLFFAVAYFKGGAAVYIGKFLAGICFGFAGIFLFNSAFAKSPWRWLSQRKSDADAA